MAGYVTVGQLGTLISARLSVPELRNVWVAGETSDVRVSGGHCYLELVDKDPATGRTSARMRGAIWANVFARLAAKFGHATGRTISAGIKVMVCGTVSYHPAFGLTFVISDIDPAYTVGEAERRRREILDRLVADGVMEMNRMLKWNLPALRIAVVSAQGAAGYGDFIHQLFANRARIRFTVKLFPAVMQGDRTVPSVLAALTEIAQEADMWDGVVIIRGGGATADLLSFDDYSLASSVAQFPIPVIVGIGHERDITVLDYVANMRVKTPTAAAEWLISQATNCLERLKQIGNEILGCATEKISGCMARLAYCEGALPGLAVNAVSMARQRIERNVLSLAEISSRRISPQLMRLDSINAALSTATHGIIERRRNALESLEVLLGALSPEATLRRGYTITRINGQAVTSAKAIKEGTEMTTVFADGSVVSISTTKQ